MVSIYLISAAIIIGAMLALWVISLLMKDASIVDIFWGMGFAFVALAAYIIADGNPVRKQLITLIAICWGFRLAFYLAWRNLGKGEDYRYVAMRKRHGGKFPLMSLVMVFGLQGVLMWVISLPLQAAQAYGSAVNLNWLDWAGLCLWLIGFSFESLGDIQLARFKSKPENQGKVMDRGLWSFTRHPNYFGDSLVWWGFYLIAFSAGAWWSIVGPLLMTFLLMRVSGVALLEKNLKKNKPGYTDYVARTNAFFPWFPKKMPRSMN